MYVFVQNVQQVVPAVVQLLHQLPTAWLTPQTGPQQVQADFTQVMVDLRRLVAAASSTPHVPQLSRVGDSCKGKRPTQMP